MQCWIRCDFQDPKGLVEAAAEKLREFLARRADSPEAVMLSGGRTPLAIFQEIRSTPMAATESVRVFMSDERMVPVESTESNLGNALPMLRALGLPPQHILPIHTDIPVQEAADRFDKYLRCFLRRGGRIPLGFLGLGADGHTAALFDLAQAGDLTGRYAIAVNRPDGREGVSVTRDLLLRVEEIIFLALGPEKKDIVNRVLASPETLPAGRAVEGARHVEIWVA